MTRKEIALTFLKMAARGDSMEAFREFVSPALIHHNAYFPKDPVVLMEAMAESARMNPNKEFTVQRALEDGDLVAVHSFIKQNAEDRGAVVMHIFRFDNNMIVEMWDFGQMLPEYVVNENGLL